MRPKAWAAKFIGMQSVFTGPVYVVRDNIDTDQIIPAQYLTLVPTIQEEYDKLGSYALCGLPDALYPARFVKEGQLDSDYPIVVAGRNFGCGSSREHAPIAMGAAGRALDTITDEGSLTSKLGEMQHRAELYELIDYEGYNHFDTSVFNFTVPR